MTLPSMACGLIYVRQSQCDGENTIVAGEIIITNREENQKVC